MVKGKNEFNWPLIGNRKITEFLTRSIENNSISSAYIFSGPDNLGKTTIANHFAKILLCKERESGDFSNLPCEKCPSCQKFKYANRFKKENIGKMSQENFDIYSTHSDYHLVKKDKEKKNISIDQIRKLIKTLNLTSFLNSYKIGIIKHAHAMSEEAANALLKTLEEPKKKVILILITSSADNLPQTVVSRCQNLEFGPVNHDIIYNYLIKEYNTTRSEAKNFSRLSVGRPALAVKFHNSEEFYNKYIERVESFIKIASAVDVNDRLEELDNIVGKKFLGQEAASETKRILEIWQGLTRDLLMLEMGHPHLIQHQVVLSELKKLKQKTGINNIFKIWGAIMTATKNLQANLNPKLILENIVISI